MRIAALIAASSFVLMGAMCQERPAPPTSVETKVPVPVPCRVAEPVCASPAYDSARKDMAMDVREQLMRAEIAQYEDCVRLYREALAACR
jgi:hypothetical protein